MEKFNTLDYAWYCKLSRITLLCQCDHVFHLLSDLMKHSPNVLLIYLCFSEEHPQPVCEVSFIKSFFDWDSEDSFSETIYLLIVSFPLKVLGNLLLSFP
ncbi:hypothetical protein YC2023_060432 [Brassica napus]